LASPEWEMKYPKATVQTLTREISYQTPLLLDTGNPSKSSISQLFKFELSWLLKDGFYELVADIWRRKKEAACIEIWQNKLRYLSKYLRGWEKMQMVPTKDKNRSLWKKSNNWIKKVSK
jgi:hypothetical protein